MQALYKSEEIATQLVEKLQRAAVERNLALWSQAFHIEDSIAAQLHQSWFEGYLCRVQPQRISINLLEAELDGEYVRAVICLRFEYAAYDPLQEVHLYTLAFIPEQQQWCVIRQARKPPLFLPEVQRSRMTWSEISPQKTVTWWPREQDLELVHASQDPLPVQVYAKAITRTVLAREEYPELECASILANLMTLSTIHLAKQIRSADLLRTLAGLYDFAQEHFTILPSRPDRDNSIQSKLHAPWFGIDEILAAGRQQGRYVSNCPSIMSFYAALLRICGFAPVELAQLRLHNHDVLLARTHEQTFLLSSEKFVPLSVRTLHYSTRMYRIFSDLGYWTTFGVTNLNSEDAAMLLDLLLATHSSIQPVRLPRLVPKAQVPQTVAVRIEQLETTCEEQIQQQVLRQVLQASLCYPHSPFTWAKYAYQTLLVPRPQVYATWSRISPGVSVRLQEYGSLSAFLEALHHFGGNSIFVEPERVMTADQVLRHKRGDARACALLLWTALQSYEKGQGCVIYTDQGTYCYQHGASGGEIWDVERLTLVSEPQGRLLLAFDDQYCLWGDREMPSEARPIWYSALGRA